MEQLLRIKSVCRITGMSKSTILRKVKAGTFPASVRLGENNVRWKKSEIEKWLQFVQSTPPEELDENEDLQWISRAMTLNNAHVHLLLTEVRQLIVDVRQLKDSTKKLLDIWM